MARTLGAVYTTDFRPYGSNVHWTNPRDHVTCSVCIVYCNGPGPKLCRGVEQCALYRPRLTVSRSVGIVSAVWALEALRPKSTNQVLSLSVKSPF